jgi:pullulanase/glycogen debranching enzyme
MSTMTRLCRNGLVALACAALSTTWAAGPATLADCDLAGTHVVLAAPPAPDATPAEARAIWLDGRLIRWPGAAGEGRYRLYHSAEAQLAVAAGQTVQGADGVLTLESHGAAPAPDVAQRFRHVGDGATLAITPSDAPRLRALLRQQLVLVREDDAGRTLAATRLQHPGALDALYAGAASLRDHGASLRRGRTQFRVWAPTAQRVALCLYAGEQGPADSLVPLRRDDTTGSWSTRHPADLGGRAYRYLVDVVVPGHGLVRNLVTDPYSLALTTDSTRSVVVDLNAPATKPPGWDATPRPARLAAPTDQVIYELHVRDFSINDASVAPSNRGRYGAFAEPASAGVQHLKRLAAAGLTDVHLLPVFDLASVPEAGCVSPAIPAAAADSEQQQAAIEPLKARDCFNWGYDPLHFTAPEGSFASEGARAVQRIVEFRRMVQALHRLGLRVGMDVVYNHTSAAGQHPHSVLDRIVPGYYQRLNAKGEIERSTCCDNTATEHLMMARLMIDSAVVWARDHRIDAFRFDLMGHQPRAAMEQLQRVVNTAAGRHIHLIGEGWNFGEVADGARFVQASQLSLNGSGIGTFSDRARDAVRGGSAGDNGVDQIVRQGYVSGLFYDPNTRAAGRATAADLLRHADLVRVGLAGSIRGFSLQTHAGPTVPLERIDYAGQPAGYVSQPGEVVNYVENHDNQTLFDSLAFKLPAGTSREDRARVQTLAHAINLLSQGIAYVHAGQELLRSKSMDRNSYDSGDWFNRIDWTAQENFFGTGLPPKQDNGASWELMRPLLADTSIKPTPAEIGFARDAFIDLLRIRASSTLLRLRTAEDIRARLRFHNTGPDQLPTVLVGQLDGRGYPGAGFSELVYLINVDKQAHTLTIDALKGRPYALHPVQAAADAADARAKDARIDASNGRVSVPARTAAVFVRP